MTQDIPFKMIINKYCIKQQQTILSRKWMGVNANLHIYWSATLKQPGDVIDFFFCQSREMTEKSSFFYSLPHYYVYL